MNPIVSLVIGALALALMTGLGVQQAVDTVARGFGDILYEVGLLIAWGVLMGADPPAEDTADDEERIGDGSSGRRGGSSLPVLEQDGSASVMTRVGTLPHAELEEAPRREAPLAVLFGPLVVSLLLMAGGGVLDIAGIQVAPLEFVSAPTVALLLGLVGTMVVARWAIGRQGLERGLGTGVRESGGARKTVTMGVSFASVIALGLVLLLSLFL